LRRPASASACSLLRHGALAGWVAFGAGLAPVAPVVLGAAAGAATLPSAVAIAAVTTVGYVGSFTGPPLVGALAAPLGLTAAMALMATAACFAALLARPAFGGARGPAGRRPARRTAGSSSEG
jgi:hypothetical protein